MNVADMAYTQLFLGTLLVPLVGLDGAHGPCPFPCRCSLEILNCSRITKPPGFSQVPLPEPDVHPHPFTHLDFTGNAISSIGKEVWKAYPWAEYLILKDNSLNRLQHSSLEGLLSLTYLDVSCNKIQIIERNVFEAVPFLQNINLSGNRIEWITEGTFQAWHGLQFLSRVDLSHNPLAVIQDSYFYRLPLLNLLDLGATHVTLRILEDLLQSSLRMLILSTKMSCCLCRIKEDIEVLCETVKLECAGSCDRNVPRCENEEPLSRMEVEVMKALEIRKLSGSSLLTILPERAVANNDTPDGAEPDSDDLVLAQNYSSLAANFNLLKSVDQLMQMKADEPVDMNWADKSELEKFYILASLLQEVLKEKMVKFDKVSPEITVQNDLSDQVLEKPTDEARKRSADTSLKKERRGRKATRENWLGRKQRQKDVLFRRGRDRRQVVKTATLSAEKPSVFESHNKAESWRKLAEGRDPQRTFSFLRSHQLPLQSSWKRSISYSPVNVLNPTGYIVIDNDDNNLTSLSDDGNYVAVLKKGLGTQILAKEQLLNPLLQRTDHPAGDGNAEISGNESPLNKLLPDTVLSHKTNWERQNTSVPLPLGFLAEDDFVIQGEHLENELNKKLTSLIPNTPVRKLLSHVIRVLKMNCTAPTLQVACAKLITRTGLLMKLISENINETSSLFWPPKNVANRTKPSSRKLEKPSGRTASQGVPAYGYGNKLLLAMSVTVIIMIILVMISLIEICSHHSTAKDKTFLGRKKKPLPDEEIPRAPSLLIDNNPLWLKDLYYIQDETQRSNMVDRLHDQESLEEMESKIEKPPSAPTHVSPIPPSPPPPSSTPQKSSVQKDSDKTEGTSETTSSKVLSSGEDEDEDEESLTEKSETASTTEITSETPVSGEGDQEDEDEESE